MSLTAPAGDPEREEEPEALKDVVASISSRFRRDSTPGVNLEKLVEQMENHEVKFKCRTTGGRYIGKVHVESFGNKCNTICLASSATDGRSIAQAASRS